MSGLYGEEFGGGEAQLLDWKVQGRGRYASHAL